VRNCNPGGGEAWTAPPATRELRGWVRHRAKLVGLRSNLKCHVHAVLAGAGVQVSMGDLFCPCGQDLLARVALTPESRARVDSALRLITGLDFEVELFGRLVTAVPAVGGRVLAAHLVDARRVQRGDVIAIALPGANLVYGGLMGQGKSNACTCREP